MTRLRALRPLAPLCLLAGLLASAPAGAAIVPEGSTTHVRMARPGDVYRGTITIRNTGKQPVEVKIYQTDYSFTADGRNDFSAPGRLPRSNARWLRLSQEQVTLPAGGRSAVQYEVAVPDDARLVGTYWSMIMVEPVTGAEVAAAPRPGEVALRQVIRHAIQVISEIGETGKGEIAFRNARLHNEDGKRFFTVDVENTGERWLRPQLRLELHDQQGRPVGKLEGQRLRVFPATSVRYRIELSGVPRGRYLGLLLADAGRDDLFGTRLELDVR